MNRIRPVSFASAATSVREIAPEVPSVGKRAIFLPGEFEAVLGYPEDGDAQLEWTRISGGSHLHRATVEYMFEPAHIKNITLKAGRYVGRFPSVLPAARSHFGEADPIHFRDAFLSTSGLSGQQFGHWVRDSLVSELHGRSLGLPSVGVARKLWPHEPAFREMSGLACRYLWEARFDRLILLHDMGHNHYWERRFMELRQTLRDRAAFMPGQSAGSHIYLSRGAGARPRDPANLALIQAMLEDLGFRTVVPSSLSAQEIAVAVRDAEMVVSAEGSHLNHLHFFAPDALKLLVLQDPHRFYAYHKGLVDFYDGTFGFIVGRPEPDTPDRFRIDLENLKRTIHLLDGAS
ncbi:glycosyltransferase 61 family protein [Sphingobium nicotianae]|nr:glycosyltransferase family 61 protein [Sphingobium nicotianae]